MNLGHVLWEVGIITFNKNCREAPTINFNKKQKNFDKGNILISGR
jgi:hypothetical protein